MDLKNYLFASINQVLDLVSYTFSSFLNRIFLLKRLKFSSCGMCKNSAEWKSFCVPSALFLSIKYGWWYSFFLSWYFSYWRTWIRSGSTVSPQAFCCLIKLLPKVAVLSSSQWLAINLCHLSMVTWAFLQLEIGQFSVGPTRWSFCMCNQMSDSAW